MQYLSAMVVTGALAVGVVLPGCRHDKDHHQDGESKSSVKAAEAPAMKTAVATIKPAGIAATRPTKSVGGTVIFTQEKDGVKVVANLTGLPPNARQGIHIHEKGDLSAPNLSTAGAHWDPAGHKHHGGPDDANVHAGDLGNIQSDAKGNATKEWLLKDVSVDGEKPSVVGKSVIVHEKVDDLKTDPSGNSGDRIAGGVIELQK